MIKSMTGYGQAEYSEDQKKFQVEMRSVNHRFCEISVRMPREFVSLEDPIKKKVQEKVKRGRVDVYVTIEDPERLSNSLTVNWNLADEYHQIHEQMNGRYNLKDTLTALDLMQFPEVLTINEHVEDLDSYREPLLRAVTMACDRLLDMRKAEGKQLREDLVGRVETVQNLLQDVKDRAPVVVEDYRERVYQRVTDFLHNQMEADESRLMTEVAVFADRADIDEELTRLESHCAQFLETLDLSDPVGRKLDFLLQEMNREVNTIGSKANDLVISRKVVELKAELEKMKEQVQNIE
ncbi:MAG: YicC family protein [Bacillaceae bacterium]|nr:YicC family protein [Bacillaceae bacterium]